MRKRSLILAFCCLALFTACKKDSTTTLNKAIIGKWYWVEQTYENFLISDNTRTRYDVYNSTLDAKSYFEFTGDGAFIEQPQGRPAGYFINGNYQIVGDSLIIKRDIDTQTSRWFIKKLTSSQLVIHRTTIVDANRGEVEYSMKR